MTNTENLRKLVDVFDIELPDILKHLQPKPSQNYGKILIDLQPDHITINKFLDPKVIKIMSNPALYELQSKDMTIVFWDLSGFSQLCFDLKQMPIAIAGLLRQYFDESIKIIQKFNGIVDKFIGDGILAYFGFDLNSTKDFGVTDALNAALEVKSTFKETRENWINSWHLEDKNIDIDVKCGIHKGNVLFGLLDTETRSQITIIGEPVNLASRLEGFAEESQIIISEEVKNLTFEKFVFRSIPTENKIHTYPEIKEVFEILSLSEKQGVK